MLRWSDNNCEVLTLFRPELQDPPPVRSRLFRVRLQGKGVVCFRQLVGIPLEDGLSRLAPDVRPIARAVIKTRLATNYTAHSRLQ
jgi:hypothetical protein